MGFVGQHFPISKSFWNNLRLKFFKGIVENSPHNRTMTELLKSINLVTFYLQVVFVSFKALMGSVTVTKHVFLYRKSETSPLSQSRAQLITGHSSLEAGLNAFPHAFKSQMLTGVFWPVQKGLNFEKLQKFGTQLYLNAGHFCFHATKISYSQNML